jgi:hypothetical protein
VYTIDIHIALMFFLLHKSPQILVQSKNVKEDEEGEVRYIEREGKE